ncbi:sulfatase-like hydrolase/transferase [Tenacibaculum sp. ZH5_bin.1]|uniref:LTA synthase family protein n=1 Tax=Tenacibaculum TaxID=104267 RepID=UPI00142F88AD|nr:alkaline phosphatase family protein [Tenacibaculum mesophilum]KAF9657712.1 sulfatase-like hydrolase/transferase [Tenacibaculum mesophilum]
MSAKIPNYLKYIFTNVFVLFVLLFIFRIIFYVFFINNLPVDANDISKALFLGARFDLRLAVFSYVPLALCYLFIKNFFENKKYKSFSVYYSVILYFIILVFYLFDFGHFSYLNLRVNANALRFLENLGISSKVFWESYPVFKGGIGILIFLFLVIKLHKIIYSIFKKIDFISPKKNRIVFGVLAVLLLSLGGYGSLKHYPLRWSEAFFSKDKKINQFALNPVLYFFDSFKFRSEGFDLEKTKEYIKITNKHLGINSDTLNFTRKISYNDSIKHQKKPNIVFVMLESTGNGALSYYGNPANSTPVLDSLLDNSINFTNHYVHKSTTAGSVFSSVTGLPDVDNIKSASRNPMIIDQRILFDQFKGYKKLYFLGGSANWANIRAVFQSNIKDLKIFEEGSYEEENRADVWGIDDYDLFKESDKELQKLHNKNIPFVAYIQTATNHMPFTVPEVKDTYRPIHEKEIDEELLNKSAYRSLAQLNAIRYLDFNIKRFLERAQKSGYFDNTIFVFFGDHQGGMKDINYYKPTEDKLGILRHNTPFFIHAPKLVKTQKITKNTHLVDVVPTVMSLAKINHINYTLGINALDSTRTNHFSFIYRDIDGEPASGVIQDSLYFYQTVFNKKSKLINLNTNSLDDISKEYPTKTKEMDSLLNGFYHSTKYLYYKNKKK